MLLMMSPNTTGQKHHHVAGHKDIITFHAGQSTTKPDAMSPSTKPDTMPPPTTSMTTTMDYHLSLLTYHHHVSVHEDGK
jgi:hypothetical protein